VGHPAGEVGVVGDDDEGDVLGAVEVEEEVGDGVGGGGVEGSGGFVGEDEFGLIDEGAGDGGAEFFAAGELPGKVAEARGEADGFEELAGALFGGGGGFGPIAGEAWDEDVFEDGELREEVVLLENEAEGVVAEGGGLEILAEDVPAFGFDFEGGEGAGGDGGDGNAEAEGGAELWPGRWRWLPRASTVRRSSARAGAVDFDLVLGDFRERADDRVDGTRVDVDAADDDHVVGAAEDPPCRAKRPGSAWRTGRTRSPVR
jgi:hypothetical protein